MILNRI